ncbi:MAG: hypothetical protein H7Z11_06170 [Verrucomicrobia bacterium]|nr:hypothetical protein [Leptolyngbya sp. ES-bin-22]
MNILRLTVLSVAFVPLLSQTVFSQSVPSTTNVTQTTNQQSTGTSQSSYTSPGTNLQTPGASVQTPGAGLQTPGVGLQTPGVSSQSTGVSSPSTGVGSQSVGVGSQSTGVGQSSSLGTTGNAGTTQTINGQPVQSSPSTTGTTGSIQTPANGQSIGPSLPSSTKVPGAEQTFVNGRSTGVTQVAPPINPLGNQTAPFGSGGTQVSPTTVLYPPQFVQGVGTAPIQPPSGVPATGTSAGTAPIQPQTTRGTATRSLSPGATQAAPTQLQPGQGTLDSALQQATCAQNWQQAIQLVNTAIAATPAGQAGSRTQLVSYRSRLQTLQSKGVRASNWAQQCRGGSVANASGQ